MRQAAATGRAADHRERAQAARELAHRHLGAPGVLRRRAGADATRPRGWQLASFTDCRVGDHPRWPIAPEMIVFLKSTANTSYHRRRDPWTGSVPELLEQLTHLKWAGEADPGTVTDLGDDRHEAGASRQVEYVPGVQTG